MSSTFFQGLSRRAQSIDSTVCVGLDPRIGDRAGADELVTFCRRIIEETHELALCYKPNSAFFEAYGPAGLSALTEVLALIPPEIPVILDAKRGDIGSTAEFYARAAFDFYKVDAVTLAPYLGKDAADPFLSYEGRGVFVLCRTTNASSPSFQDLVPVGGDTQLFAHVAREAVSWSSSVGLVVAGNDLAALRTARVAAPEAWFLSPGIGAQGGSVAEAVGAGLRGDGLGLIASAGRSVAAADSPGAALSELVDEFRRARDRALEAYRARGASSAAEVSDDAAALKVGRKARVLGGILDVEGFRVGDFVLKSGKHSPFYVDLRRLVSQPALLDEVARAYAELSAGLRFDRIAAIPMAALPIATALSLRLGVPLVYPRLPAKKHGTGNRVEGAFSAGERVLLVDDLITTGGSKIEAAGILRELGLEVADLLVLIERGRRGRTELAEAGIDLHAYADIRELFALCRERSLVDEEGETRLEAYVEAGE